MNANNPDEKPPAPQLETDERFPSCRWIGFWLQPPVVGRQPTELHLTFSDGKMTGTGFDRVGEFAIQGEYSVESGVCDWRKLYLGAHSVYYHGFNESRGIWGVWEIRFGTQMMLARGGFHIWPETMPDPTGDRLAEEADLPGEVDDVPIFESQLTPV